MLNHITIMARIAKDIELRRTPSGVAVASFTVACDRDYGQNGQKETDFIDCVAWRGTGEFIERNFCKGKMIVISGRLQIRKWEDKHGNKRSTAEINVENAYFADSKKDAGGKYEADKGRQDQDYAVMDGDDDDLPFKLPF